VLDPQAAKEARIREIFTGQRKLLAQLFPKDGDTYVARAVSSAIMESRKISDKTGRPNLDRCPAEDIAEKAIAAHHMGLEPGSECYFIPYGAKLQLQIGPQGLIKLMMQSGFVRKIEARSVRGAGEPGGDVFDYDLGDEGFIKHRKGDMRWDMAVTHGYAFIETSTGGKIRDVLTRGEIDHFRSLSKMPEGGPMWKEHFDGAVRKTMIHRIAEFVPRSPVLSAVLQRDTSEGLEVPDEIWQAVRGQLDKSRIAEIEGTSREVVTLPADEGREQGASS
jgi:phage RecT family recombinase